MAFLSLSVAIQEKLKINYFSIEKYPLSENEYTMLNYTRHIFPEYSRYFGLLHQVPWDIETLICPEFSLKKIKTDLKIFKYDGMPLFDLIYFDAFAPGKQPEMWSYEIFEKIAQQTAAGGTIVTYCAKGTVRRMLNELGFQMERLAGPIGKKEILRGIKRL